MRKIRIVGAMFCGAVMCAAASGPAAADPLPFKYRVTDPGCVVAVAARFRDSGHRTHAFSRIFLSFGEFALEREEKGDLPEAGLSWAIADLLFLHFDSGCGDRVGVAQRFVDDYHGRFPDDAELSVRPDTAPPPHYLGDHVFTRVKPVDRIADCRLSFGYQRGPKDPDGRTHLDYELFEANKDLRRLTGTLTPQMAIDWDDRKGRMTAIFIDGCDRRLEILKEVTARLLSVYPGIATFTFPTVAKPEPPRNSPDNPYYRDTRSRLFEYLPPIRRN